MGRPSVEAISRFVRPSIFKSAIVRSHSPSPRRRCTSPWARSSSPALPRRGGVPVDRVEAGFFQGGQVDRPSRLPATLAHMLPPPFADEDVDEQEGEDLVEVLTIADGPDLAPLDALAQDDPAGVDGPFRREVDRVDPESETRDPSLADVGLARLPGEPLQRRTHLGGDRLRLRAMNVGRR